MAHHGVLRAARLLNITVLLSKFSALHLRASADNGIYARPQRVLRRKTTVSFTTGVKCSMHFPSPEPLPGREREPPPPKLDGEFHWVGIARLRAGLDFGF